VAYDIILGRTRQDKERFGLDGTIFLGRHYVQMGQTVALSNSVYLDMIRSHVVFVCGKRGGGKSYTMGVIAEGMADLPQEIRQNLSIVILDTMGIYWTMKYPNQKERELLEQWKMEPKPLDITIFTPQGFYRKAQEEGIPTDRPFAIRPSELLGSDWNTTFGIAPSSDVGVLIERIVHDLKERDEPYAIQHILDAIAKDPDAEKNAKAAAKNHFIAAQGWGLFSERATPLAELAAPGKVSVLDLSAYASQEHGWAIKALVTGIVSQKLFLERSAARKEEEFRQVKRDVHYLADDDDLGQRFPLVWLVIDEAHEFLPKDGATLATDPLVSILREGRQPGISLILASQQPGKIHTDVMTQSDVVISHRITAKIDTDALGALMQSYLRKGLDTVLDELPRTSGAALVLDDNNEKMFPIQVRPRFTWHGGESPSAIKKERELFEY
jgi:DNA helicase HerA-like ATPase